jgi:hypothetical protein
VAEEAGSRNGIFLALGFLTGAAATVAVLATRLRIYHYGECPECRTPLVVSYEPTDAQPCIRREDAVELPPDSRAAKAIRHAREHPRRPCRTVIVIE